LIVTTHFCFDLISSDRAAARTSTLIRHGLFPA
jgi:hypothetical protein